MASAEALPLPPLDTSPPAQTIALNKTSTVTITWRIQKPTKILWGGRDIAADILLKAPNPAFWDFAAQDTVPGTIGTKSITAKNCYRDGIELRCQVSDNLEKVPYTASDKITFKPKVIGMQKTPTKLMGVDNLIRYWDAENPLIARDALVYYAVQVA